MVSTDKSKRSKLLINKGSVYGQRQRKLHGVVATEFLPRRESYTQRNDPLIYTEHAILPCCITDEILQTLTIGFCGYFLGAPLSSETGCDLDERYTGNQKGMMVGGITELIDLRRSCFDRIAFDQSAAVQKVYRHSVRSR